MYQVSCKSLINSKPLYISFDKIDEFIRVYGETRYFVLYRSEIGDFIYSKIRFFISVKSRITYIIFHNYAKTKVDSEDSLTLEKTATFHNIIKLTKSVFNKDKIHYYCNMFLEKASYELPKK